MASFFPRLATKRVIGGVAAGGVGLGTAQQYSNQKQATINRDAEIEFDKSFGYKDVVKLPPGFAPFQIKNQYPTSKDIPKRLSASSTDQGTGLSQVPEPERYCDIIKTYCWSGNTNNNFNIHKNHIRPWYHAPWMHWHPNGREPINGLTFERPLNPGELSKDQKRRTQSWAIGFYNWMGATAFGDMWQNRGEPNWDNHISFPLGTCVFKILLTEATEQEVPSLKGAPTLEAVIATVESVAKPRPDASQLKTEPDVLRLLQVDFAVRDNRVRVCKDGTGGNGWVFGTFMYDGSKTNETDAWIRIIPVGLQWGNDPYLTPEAVEKGEKPQQSWINPEAVRLLKSLGGTRAEEGWGAGGRLNGPVDNFVSACASCHSTAERSPNEAPKMTPPEKDPADPKWSEKYMLWFRNLGPGQSFGGGDARSADYSLQLMSGYNNYKKWRGEVNGWTNKVKVMIPYSKARAEAKVIDAKRTESR